MNWLDFHRKSEQLSSDANVYKKRGDIELSLNLYRQAAEFEQEALSLIDNSKTRTLGIIAVSATSLWFKAKEYEKAQQLSYLILHKYNLPPFALQELQLLLQTIWTEQTKSTAGINFANEQLLVSVKGKEVVVGGAPLDLIVEKVQIIQSIFYRSIEFLRGLPHRKKGNPSKEIQESFRPWLFQAPPGSYQFSVAIQSPKQLDMFNQNIEATNLVENFLKIVKATIDSDDSLSQLVPDKNYQSTFMKLSRNLSPNGKSFDRLEIRNIDGSNSILITPEDRQTIGKRITSTTEKQIESKETLYGILRAVHLDKDWLDLNIENKSVHITDLRDTVDDVIGPLINKPVRVTVSKSSGHKFRFIDIEADE